MAHLLLDKLLDGLDELIRSVDRQGRGGGGEEEKEGGWVRSG